MRTRSTLVEKSELLRSLHVNSMLVRRADRPGEFLLENAVPAAGASSYPLEFARESEARRFLEGTGQDSAEWSCTSKYVDVQLDNSADDSTYTLYRKLRTGECEVVASGLRPDRATQAQADEVSRIIAGTMEHCLGEALEEACYQLTDRDLVRCLSLAAAGIDLTWLCGAELERVFAAGKEALQRPTVAATIDDALAEAYAAALGDAAESEEE
jgi:hypothetical protein